MSGKRIVMWQVPKEQWQGGADRETAIGPFVRDALDIEHRLPKGVNLANERMRYQLCCRRIQNAVLQNQLASEHESLDEEIFALLRNLATKAQPALTKNRLAACFFPPELVEKAVTGMEALVGEFKENKNVAGAITLRKRLLFFENALAKAVGVVETLDFLVEKAEASFLLPPDAILTKLTASQADKMQAQEDCRPREVSSSYKNLLAGIEQAIRTGGAVNFSNQPHPVVTEVLNKIVYAEDGQEPAVVRVVYLDGTEAAPFPVRCLQRKTADSLQGKFIRLRASLVSMRHLEMDGRVDLAWFRNRQVSSGGSFAEVDTFCTEQTMNLLRGMPPDQKVALEMYQTGLETAVVGFYRGLVRFFLEQRDGGSSFQVQSMYYNGEAGDYEKGAIWA